MKKCFLILLLTALIFGLTGCSKDRMILDGYNKSEEYWDKSGFQDYTDYCKYYYNDSNLFKENSYYKLVKQTDIEELRGYFNNFYEWMKTSNRLNEYDFLNDYISEGDYFYIKTKEGEKIGNSYYGKYDNYTIYFFDTDQNILYYIHSNM